MKKNYYIIEIIIYFSLFALSYSQPIVDYRNYQTPVKNQYDRGTCTAFAIASMLETIPGLPSDISEQYIYGLAQYHYFKEIRTKQKLFLNNNISYEGNGSFLKYYFFSIPGNGIFPEESDPYDGTFIETNEKEDDFEKFKKDLGSNSKFFVNYLTFDKPYNILKQNFYYLEKEQACNSELIKSLLNNGVKAIAISYIIPVNIKTNIPYWLEKNNMSINNKFSLSDIFYKINNDLFFKDNYSEHFLTGHAVTIVGYDKNGFLFKNSWGTDWGEDGYGWVDFKYHDIFASEGLYMDPKIWSLSLKNNFEEFPIEKLYLKSLPYSNKKECSISLSFVSHHTKPLPMIDSISYSAYNSNGDLILKHSIDFSQMIGFRSKGYEIIYKNLFPCSYYTIIPKLKIKFYTKNQTPFSLIYKNIEPKNREYTPQKTIDYLLNDK